MPQYRKRPIVVEARQMGQSYESDMAIKDWCGGVSDPVHDADDAMFHIPTAGGRMMVGQNDWVVHEVSARGISFAGHSRSELLEFYAITPDVFAHVFELLPDDAVAPEV